ncbi:MAG: 2-oxoacid:acceptor oxidoreductase family protein [Promethearchaeota archaeon]
MTREEEANELINIIIHGRGGQGGVTASQIIAEAAFNSGKFTDVHAYPSFGAERRGAPVQAFAKLSKKEVIWDRAQIEHPDIVIVLDETIITPQIVKSINNNGIMIINTNKDPQYFIDNFELNDGVKIIVADVSQLAMTHDLIVEGILVVNVPILGLLTKAIPEISMSDLKAIVLKYFGEIIGKKNIELMEKSLEIMRISG